MFKYMAFVCFNNCTLREDLNRLPYLTMCIKEGMRCHNPVPTVSRELTKPMVMNGVELLPGTGVMINIGMYIHNNYFCWDAIALYDTLED